MNGAGAKRSGARHGSGADESASSPLRLLMIGASWSHLGRHSGLAPLSGALRARYDVAQVEPGWREHEAVLMWRIGRRLRARLMAREARLGWSPFYTWQGRLLEVTARRMAMQRHFDVVFFEALEDQFDLFAGARKWLPDATRIAGVSHQPPAWWRKAGITHNVYESVDTLIAPSREAVTFLADGLGHRNVHFVPHGVDIDFFGLDPVHRTLPAPNAVNVLFCGDWLRDVCLLRETVDELATRGMLERFRFHFIVPLRARTTVHHHALAQRQNVRWYAALSDEELRGMYISCDVLYLPLLEATANNTLLEGMATGLPIVVSKVGGVTDYLRDDECTFLVGRCASGGADCLMWVADHYAECVAKAERARQRCAQQFAWGCVGDAMIRLATGERSSVEAASDCRAERDVWGGGLCGARGIQ